MDRKNRKVLLLSLCKYFRLEYEEIEGIDEIKMLYVYSSVTKESGQTNMKEVLKELDALNIRFRNRQRNLNTIYYHLKNKSMFGSGHYDTSTSHAPRHFWRFDDY